MTDILFYRLKLWSPIIEDYKVNVLVFTDHRPVLVMPIEIQSVSQNLEER